MNWIDRMEIICRKPYVLPALRAAFPEATIRETFGPCRAGIVIAEPRELVAANLGLLPALRLALCARAGCDEADTAWLRQHNVRLCTARGVYSVPVAEDILCKVLQYATNAWRYAQQQVQKCYEPITDRRCLQSMTVGLVGAGSIASAAAVRLQAFGCRVLGYKRRPAGALPGFDALYYGEDLDAMLGRCDIVVVCVDLNPGTRHLFDAARFAAMRHGAVFLNISRGAVVDEAALTAALQNGRLAYAALDVFEQEPLPVASPLWDLPQVVLTPHSSGLCMENHDRYAALAVAQIRAFLAGEMPENQIL